MKPNDRLIALHRHLTRRHFLRTGCAGAAVLNAFPFWSNQTSAESIVPDVPADWDYLTPDGQFINYGRGNPPPYQLSDDKRREVGLHPDTWQLEIFPDPDSDSVVERPLLKENGTALDWKQFMALAERHAVRYMSAVSCTNGRKPCGMGLWEGVPLREILWMARPSKNVRRVYYYGYHNDDPKQRFQSSLPVGRILEDPPGEHPVILAYKLNDRWLSAIRGGPARIIVPELYANKSVKWIQKIVLTNDYMMNDTYALWNNDTESHLKTWACFVHVPETVGKESPIPITGLAQVGTSGLSRVQYFLQPQNEPLPEDDVYFSKAAWKVAEILPPPNHWGSELPGGQLPSVPRQIDGQTGQPYEWPLRNTLVHWAVVLNGVAPGIYDIRCRAIDAQGIAQPMPRPFLKSGYNAIQQKQIIVQA